MAELTEDMAAKLAAELAALNANVQSAQQTSQQINQSIADMLTKLSTQTATTASSTQVLQEETGFAERVQKEMQDNSGILFSNVKRTYDEFQHESLESIRRNRSYVDKVLADVNAHDGRVRVIAEQALQNAVETANMVGKQVVRTNDIAADNQWNPVQQGAADTLTARAVSIDDASLKAIGAVVAAAVADALKPKA